MVMNGDRYTEHIGTNPSCDKTLVNSELKVSCSCTLTFSFFLSLAIDFTSVCEGAKQCFMHGLSYSTG
jgi:hypothetical protein